MIDTNDNLPVNQFEHGEVFTDQELQSWATDNDAILEHHHFDDLNIRLFKKINPDQEHTLIFVPGGIGRLYRVQVDNPKFKEGPVFPANMPEFINDKFGLALVDIDHSLPWSWATSELRINNKSPMEISNIVSMAKQRNKDNVNVKILKTILALHYIIKEVQKTTNSKIWLVGHCTSADLVSRYYNCFRSHSLLSGLVLLNPRWKTDQEVDDATYFNISPEIPLVVIQHQDDPCPRTSVSAAKSISSSAERSFYKSVSGGIDQGYHSFSLGYHGFRDIEKQLADSIAEGIFSFK